MSFLKLQNGKVNYLFYVMLFCLIGWCTLTASSFYIAGGTEKVSTIAAKIEFLVNIVTLCFLIYICKSLKRGTEGRKEMLWLFSICLMLFLVDIFFYLAAYVNDSYLMQMTVFQFLLYYFPCILGCFMMVIFMSYILLRDVLHTSNFLKIAGGLVIINLVIIALFLSSIHYAYKVISWETISQLGTLAEELVFFDFAILGLIYATSLSAYLLLSGLITIVAGDYFLTYTYISQSVRLFSYGELIYLLGLMLIMFSVIRITQYKDYSTKSWFRSPDMIKSRLAFWTFCISSAGFLLFFLIAYAFSLVDKAIFVSLPLFVMLYSVIAVTLSVFMGKNFETPFKNLANNIEIFMASGDKNKIQSSFSIAEFAFLQKFILNAFEVHEEKDKVQKELGAITVQVAHDIRSPVAALNAVVKETVQIPEQQRIIMRNATQQINDIANNLLAKYRNRQEISQEKNKSELNEPEVIAILLDYIISEKRVQYKHLPINISLQIDTNAYGSFAKVVASDFKRVISNIVNNAVEAMNGRGEIIVRLYQTEDSIVVEIIDQGIGMSSDLIKKVFDGRLTSNKKEGAGIGLLSARKLVESWGGELQITSVPNTGTVVHLTFELLPAASWFASELLFVKGTKVVILDDDQSIHDVWESRFSNEMPQANLQLVHFYQAKDLISQNIENLMPAHFLCDYELIGQEETGLDVIEKLRLWNFSTLVTSRYDSYDIRTRCTKENIKILPKNYAPYVPLKVVDGETVTVSVNTNSKDDKVDLVLIDDNDLVINTWKFLASVKNKKILTFNSFKEFLDHAPAINYETPIYIDSNLGEGVSGEERAKQLYNLGFKIIYLTTGYDSSNLEAAYYLTGIIGKDPPF